MPFLLLFQRDRNSLWSLHKPWPRNDADQPWDPPATGFWFTFAFQLFKTFQSFSNVQPSIPVSTASQLVIIWSVTAVATGSVLTGVGYGIRRISEICFSAGMFLMLIVLLLDNTVYLLNLYVQSMGFYVHNLLQLSFHSDAFEQLGASHGADDRGEVLPEGVESSDGPEGWMNGWTIFYWGWWIAWSPFVGQ